MQFQAACVRRKLAPYRQALGRDKERRPVIDQIGEPKDREPVVEQTFLERMQCCRILAHARGRAASLEAPAWG